MLAVLNTFQKGFAVREYFGFHTDAQLLAFLKYQSFNFPGKFGIIITDRYPQHFYPLPLQMRPRFPFAPAPSAQVCSGVSFG